MLQDISGFNEILWDLILFLAYMFPVVMLVKVIEKWFIEIALPFVASLFLSDGDLSASEELTLNKLDSFFFIWTRIRASIILFFIAWILILFAGEFAEIFI